jgi:hypothetical protein
MNNSVPKAANCQIIAKAGKLKVAILVAAE